MSRYIKNRSKKVGLAPGSLVHLGEKMMDKIKISIIDFDESHIEERKITHIEELTKYRDSATNTWINVSGIHQTDAIEQIGLLFKIHPLLIEDILNTQQPPKFDDLENVIFIIIKMIAINELNNEIIQRQITLVLGKKYVLTIQEVEDDFFNPLIERIRHSYGRIRKSSSDYICYAIIDLIIDKYFIVLEKFGERIEEIEENVINDPNTEILNNIHNLKRELLYLRKAVYPLREIIYHLYRGNSQLISEQTIPYLKDVNDHTVQIIDTIETFREMLATILEIYLSSISNKTNEVTKMLSLIATIFIPLTFIAGVYGMNFRFMPELEWEFGYYFALSIMISVGMYMFKYFKRKKWL